MRKFVRAMCHPGAQSAIGSIMVLLLTIALIACGGDSGTSPSDVIPDSVPGSPSSSSVKKSSSSSVTLSSSSVIQSGDSHEGSSNSKQSSSSVIPASSGNLPSSSSKKNGESSSAMTSSSSSSKKVESSSSEYVPFDHKKTLANSSKVGKDAYKQFTDPRNGRSYYYITITSSKTGKSVTVMAENLNIGEMVPGENDQNDDTKIERYCYNNDTTNFDKYGGLYQWAEMMQLPSRCNTESCYKKIRRDHQGICPEGWRLFTWDDYEIIRDYNDKYGDGIKGLRSQCFQGKNTNGFSLIGGGLRTEDGVFEELNTFATWFRPEEYMDDKEVRAHHTIISSLVDDPVKQNGRELKVKGFSVRCTKIE